ncbi:hypothetical protein HOD08_01905 [bacterium]|nr:hypothetical protein [bacterium]
MKFLKLAILFCAASQSCVSFSPAEIKISEFAASKFLCSGQASDSAKIYQALEEKDLQQELFEKINGFTKAWVKFHTPEYPALARVDKFEKYAFAGGAIISPVALGICAALQKNGIMSVPKGAKALTWKPIVGFSLFAAAACGCVALMYKKLNAKIRSKFSEVLGCLDGLGLNLSTQDAQDFLLEAMFVNMSLRAFHKQHTLVIDNKLLDVSKVACDFLGADRAKEVQKKASAIICGLGYEPIETEELSGGLKRLWYNERLAEMILYVWEASRAASLENPHTASLRDTFEDVWDGLVGIWLSGYPSYEADCLSSWDEERWDKFLAAADNVIKVELEVCGEVGIA